MSKLSFRARALDANKSLPVYHADDIPDLSDYGSVNRVVPQMPTGMEKEEETEHHLQRAITAQQIYGEAQRLIIPTPEAIFDDSDYQQLKQREVSIPKQYVHVQAFTLEDELPDYDYDEADEAWLKKFNATRAVKLGELEFERLYECLDRACGNQPETLSLSAAHFVLKAADDDVIQGLYEYWQRKRGVSSNCNTTTPGKNDKKDSSSGSHDPYIAFRRRVEKMQTRKNRKNDEASYEKMIKLRRDLQRACMILDMVKRREETKRNILQTTVDVYDKRYTHGDFSGELIMQCFDILRRRQSVVDRRRIDHPGRTGNAAAMERREHEEQQRRFEMSDELRKRHLKSHKSRLLSTDGSTSLAEMPEYAEHLSEPEDEPCGPDGKFTFKRRKGVIYKAPRYDIPGNWPWVHPVEGGTASQKFRYCFTTLSKAQRSIGFARRRRGRGGRILFDRTQWPFEDYVFEREKFDTSTLPNGLVNSPQSPRAPPWPHFRSLSDIRSEHEARTTNTTTGKGKLQRTFTDEKKTPTKPSLHRSFSSQPTSKFRVHPYGVGSTTLSRSETVSDISVTSTNLTTHLSFGNSSDQPNTVSTVSTQPVDGPCNALLSPAQTGEPGDHNVVPAPVQHKPSQLLQRLPSTAPTSAVYQLNFPILLSNSTASHSPAVSLQSRRANIRTENGSVTHSVASSHKATKLAANKLSIVTPKAPPGNGINTPKAVVGTLDALPGFNTFRSAAAERSVAAISEVK